MSDQGPEEHKFSEDAQNRMWQHGLHEERLFHDRLNYFSVVEIGLLSVFAILYSKERAVGLLIALICAALVFTVFWLALQYKHWRYCVFIHARMRQIIPDYQGTVEAYFGERSKDMQLTAFAFSKPLSLAPPVLFALTWTAFLIWVCVA